MPENSPEETLENSPEETKENIEPPFVKLTVPQLPETSDIPETSQTDEISETLETSETSETTDTSEIENIWLVIAKNRRVNRDWEALIQRHPENSSRCYNDLRTAPTIRQPGRVFPLKGKKYRGYGNTR